MEIIVEKEVKSLKEIGTNTVEKSILDYCNKTNKIGRAHV